MALCAAGPAGCAVGGGLTLGQAILGGAAALLGGATILNQKKPRVSGNKPPKTVAGEGSDDEDEKPIWDEAANRRRINALAAERAGTFSGAYDPRNYCNERYDAEERECKKRYPDYAHEHYLNGCLETAQIRRNQCTANGGRPLPGEREKWGLGAEESYHRDFLRRLLSEPEN